MLDNSVKTVVVNDVSDDTVTGLDDFDRLTFVMKLQTSEHKQFRVHQFDRHPYISMLVEHFQLSRILCARSLDADEHGFDVELDRFL